MSRSLIVAALVLGAVSLPANAREVETFKAWNHEYWVPVQAPPVVDVTSPAIQPVWGTRSAPLPVRFTSTAKRPGRSTTGVSEKIETINVWGARIDVPAH
jgi:hypothetical protein